VHAPETNNFSAHLARIGAELDRFITGEYGDAMQRHAEWTEALSVPLPDDGIGADGVVDELERVVIPNGMRLAEPGFWGWVTVAPTTVPVAAMTAAAIASPQRYTLTAFNLLEELSLDWLAELCGLPSELKGVYSSGGSVANLVALGAARQWALEQSGIDPAADGFDGRRAAVYTSTEAHHTVQRSAGVLGIGRANVRLIRTDERQRMDVDALRTTMRADAADGVLPIAVVAAAGTTNTGAIDPLRAAGEIAREQGAWFHVDGAYGLPAILDDRVAHLFDGLELADSVIVDPHKWLRAPVGIAATFVRDRSILHRAFTQEEAPYLEGSFGEAADARSSLDSIGIPYADFALELSAPARGVAVWSILRELGREGVRAQIRRDNDFARHLGDRVRQTASLELLAEPTLSICCFRYAADDVGDLNAFNALLHRRLVQETPFLPSATVVNGNFALRPCFINARTRQDDVDGLVAAVGRIGDELRVAAPAHA
jgi:aromatic-L-amino-acid/L-tryptophan decarboxylase